MNDPWQGQSANDFWNPQVMYRGRPVAGRSKALLQTMFESIGEGIFIVDVEPQSYRFVTCNPAFSQMFGIPASSLERLQPQAFLPPLLAERLCLHMDGCIQERQPVRYEETLPTPTNLIRTLTITLSPVLEGNKPITQLVGSCQDITERKRAEMALQQSQQRLQTHNRVLVDLGRRKNLNRGNLQAALHEITETVAQTLACERVSVWIYSHDRACIVCVDLFQLSTNQHTSGMELAAQDYPSYFAALQTERTLAVYSVATDPRTRELAEKYCHRSQIVSLLDAPIWVEGQIAGILCHEHVGSQAEGRRWAVEEENFAGSLADLVALAIEASERQQTQEALRQAEERYRNFFENAVEGIFFTNTEGRYLSANPTLARIYGYDSPQEMMINITDIGHQLYVEPTRREEFIRLLMWRESVQGFESQIRRKDGSLIWISENARVVRNREGQLIGYEGTVEDITARKQKLESIEFKAYHDALTGLAKRDLFLARLEHALSHPTGSNEMVAVLFLDLDRFKVINDTLGHSVGDALLKRVGERLSQCVRSGDTIARWGGDEFTLLLPQLTSVEQVSRLAERILEALNTPMACEDHELTVTCSIGIAIYPQHGQDSQTLLNHADQALYQVKASGRNSFYIYDPMLV
ncbi:MAG: diguanylate cyclase [Cyanobacteriota bacterium]|nr:diguanylate cyclase [Cyanobacteriota bacterium]